jgi:hypothetical protein
MVTNVIMSLIMDIIIQFIYAIYIVNNDKKAKT